MARVGLDALFAGKSGVIAGRLNRAAAFGTRLVSRRRLARVTLAATQG